MTGTLLAHIPVCAVGVDGGEVLERTLGVRLHRLPTFAPVCGAHLAVLVLEGERRTTSEYGGVPN